MAPLKFFSGEDKVLFGSPPKWGASGQKLCQIASKPPESLGIGHRYDRYGNIPQPDDFSEFASNHDYECHMASILG